MSETNATTLYTALLAAMSEFGAVLKNKQNPHLKNYYADLGAVLEAVTEPLANHGLLISQRFTHDQGCPILITEIIHAESGQTHASALPIVSKDPTDPQKLGGAITYARRYSLLAILSLTAEDDDGNAAARPAPPRQSRDIQPTTGGSYVAPHRQQPSREPTASRMHPPAEALAPAPGNGTAPLDTATFERLIEACWTMVEDGEDHAAIKDHLNARRHGMTKEQRAIALEQLAAMETAIKERAALPFASAAG